MTNHHLECMCEHCERTGSGYFAERAALAGDASAATRLSPAVYKFLVAERIRRRARLKNAAAPSQLRCRL